MTSVPNLLRSVDAVFFDFDGPVCSVFAGYPAPDVAVEMLEALRSEVGGLPLVVAAETDPMEVLRWTGRAHPNLVALADKVLCSAEMIAVDSAKPAPYAHAAIEAARRRAQSVAIVSNNSASAIEKYLDRNGLSAFVDFVAGRPFAEPDRMKPNPDALIRAADSLKVKPGVSLLVGDTVTDIEACLRAGVHPIGYSEWPDRRLELEKAGAVTVISSMAELM
ncbi:HAD family hydrolase [Lentzea terrae]|uniref:HAD family hydrolase n=1 Tax=Lentzea terrae TaxID=2200761 RepID=UPI0013006364|nr:HAD-IA family hydrolase [Lentzea terrae]